MSQAATVTRVFIDESGSPEPFISTLNEQHDKYLTICATIIKEPDYRKYKAAMAALCKKYEEPLDGKEIKSRSIRYSNPRNIRTDIPYIYSFHLQKNPIDLYDAFCADLKSVLKETNFKVVSVTTNKEVAAAKYPRLDVHRTLLLNLWERISIYNFLNDRPKMLILFDPSKAKYDEALMQSYMRFQESGSIYFSAQRLDKVNLSKWIYPCDSADSRGIQLSDLCAYPIKSFIERGKNGFYSEIVKPKLHGYVKDTHTNKYVMMGRKKSLI